MRHMKQTAQPINEPFDRQKLQNEADIDDVFKRMGVYIRHQERQPPPNFIGRQKILKDLGTCLDEVGNDNSSGMTRIVQGVPGAGKTSLCAEFIKLNHGRTILGEMVRNPDKTDAEEDAHLPDKVQKKRVVLCLEVTPDVIAGPPLNLAAEIRNQLLDAHAALKGEAGQAARDRKTGLTIANALGAIFQRDKEACQRNQFHFLNMQSGLSACLNAYAKDLWGDDIILALCVDEMQNCEATAHAKASLNVLHNVKHNARIAPLFFGLCHTEQHIAEKLKLTRLNPPHTHPIGALEPVEARQVIDSTMGHLGVAWSNPAWRAYVTQAGFDETTWATLQTQLADIIDAEAQGFPQHLTAGLIGLCETLQARRKYLAPELAGALVEEVQENHLDGKAAYYEKRLVNAKLQKHRMALGAICRLAEQSHDGCVDEADARRAVLSGPGEELTKQDAKDVLKAAVRAGLLMHWEDYAQYGPPSIPSMQAHLSNRLRQDVENQKASAVRLNDTMDLQLQSAHTHEP